MNDRARNAEHESLEMESYSVLEAGIYRSRLEAIHALDTKFGEALRFTWKVIGGESDGETFDALVNKKLMPKSKLATWAKAHLGLNQFPEGFVLKLSNLIGKEVHITLSTEARNDGSGDRNTVQAVSPYRPAAKKSKAPVHAQGNGFGDALEDNIPDFTDAGEPRRQGEGRVEAAQSEEYETL